ADKLRLIRSPAFVLINGINFRPYAMLLLSPLNEVRIAARLVVVTDGDGADVAQGEVTTGARRTGDLEVLVGLEAADLLDVVINDYSLKTELVRAGNADVQRNVYLKLHARSGDRRDSAVRQADAAQTVAIHKFFKMTRKGDFARLVAEEINTAHHSLCQAI
ncbi:putative ATP-dependent endonuclease of OLD family, partial [Bradyrhizobium sp. ERR14]|nr:putative ATP-dependent endonuclease of OLD family [Bradyrhizobium sp. ERR14]